jgi:hypothetical protein
MFVLCIYFSIADSCFRLAANSAASVHCVELEAIPWYCDASDRAQNYAQKMADRKDLQFNRTRGDNSWTTGTYAGGKQHGAAINPVPDVHGEAARRSPGGAQSQMYGVMINPAGFQLESRF